MVTFWMISSMFLPLLFQGDSIKPQETWRNRSLTIISLFSQIAHCPVAHRWHALTRMDVASSTGLVSEPDNVHAICPCRSTAQYMYCTYCGVRHKITPFHLIPDGVFQRGRLAEVLLHAQFSAFKKQGQGKTRKDKRMECACAPTQHKVYS